MRWARLAIFSLIIAVLAGCGRSADPIAELRAEVRRNPGSAETRIKLGDAYLESGAYHDAYIQYLAALDRDAGSYDAAFGLARAQEALADIPGARKSVNDALTIKPEAAEALALKGKLLLGADDAEGAAAAFEKALAQAPDNEQAHIYLPIAHIRMDQLGKAEASARAGLKQMPQSIEAHLNLALVLAARDKGAEAESVLRHAIEVDPTSAVPPLRLAELLVRDGRKLTEAIELADRSMELEPGDGSSDAVAAMALQKLGRQQEAVQRLHSAAMANPRNVRLWMMLASGYRAIGEEEAAARAAGMAFRFSPRRRVRAAPGADGGSGSDDNVDGVSLQNMPDRPITADEAAAEGLPISTENQLAPAPMM